MSSSFTGFTSRPTSVSDAFDQLRSAVEQRMGARQTPGGDVRAAVLTLLSEKPMHGAELISEIAQRSGGSWKPTAGQVYPTLQLLADEGLVTAEVTDGRRTYSLTAEGKAKAETSAGRGFPEAPDSRLRVMSALPKSGMDLASAAAQVQRTGTPEQVKEAVAVLDEARRKLYSILAQG